MNIHSTLPTTADEFLRWNEGREGRREFVDGKVVEMMINVTENHYRLASRLLVQLAAQLDDAEFIVGSADFGVRTQDGVRYPDVMIHKPVGGKKLATAAPLFLAEVLSPSTMANDFGPKANDYLGIESLKYYLVLSQEEISVWVWSRAADGGWDGPTLCRDAAEKIVLAHLGVSLDLDKLYAGIASA